MQYGPKSITISIFFRTSRSIAAPGSIDVFARREMGELFELLRSQYDYVFVDLSPLSPVLMCGLRRSFATSICWLSSGVSTKVDLVKHGLSTAPRVWEKLLGVILNRADLGRLRQFDHSGIIYYDSEYFRSSQDFDVRPIGQLVHSGAEWEGRRAPQLGKARANAL